MKQLCLVQIFFFMVLSQIGGFTGRGNSLADAIAHQNNNEHDDEDDESKCVELCYGMIIGVIGGVVVIVGLLYLIKIIKAKCFSNRTRIQIEQKFFSSHPPAKIEWELHKNKLIQKYEQMYYLQEENKINVQIMDKEFKIETKSQIQSLKIFIKARDQIGLSTLNGSIISSGGQFFILLFKDYKNKQAAKQNIKNYSILVYEGESQDLEDGFKGHWYYHFAPNTTGFWKWTFKIIQE